MSTLKGRNAHKGRTFGGVAACPHCSAPIRMFVTAARVQCVVDVVAASHSFPTQPLDLEVGVETAVDASGVSRVRSDIVGAVDAPVVDETLPANVPADAFPVRGGFDDDEAPSPT